MLVPAMRSSSVCQLHHGGASLDCRVRQWPVPSPAVASTNSQPLAAAVCARDGGLGGAAIRGCISPVTTDAPLDNGSMMKMEEASTRRATQETTMLSLSPMACGWPWLGY